MESRTRLFAEFAVAGLRYWDAVEVHDSIKVGARVTLVPEFDNPYDPNAVALYLDGKKIGFVPRGMNEGIAQLLYFGHDIFDAFVSEADFTRSVSEQVHVVVKVKDARGEQGSDAAAHA